MTNRKRWAVVAATALLTLSGCQPEGGQPAAPPTPNEQIPNPVVDGVRLGERCENPGMQRRSQTGQWLECGKSVSDGQLRWRPQQ